MSLMEAVRSNGCTSRRTVLIRIDERTEYSGRKVGQLGNNALSHLQPVHRAHGIACAGFPTLKLDIAGLYGFQQPNILQRGRIE